MFSIAVVLLGCGLSADSTPADGGLMGDANAGDTGIDGATPPVDGGDADAQTVPDAGSDAQWGADAATDGGEQWTESDISVCRDNVDCIVVPYSHCCGSTKRAIHSSFLDVYNAHPEWQVFNDPSVCALIGACLSDSAVTEARCDNGNCALVFP